jgi:hypothetical protein
VLILALEIPNNKGKDTSMKKEAKTTTLAPAPDWANSAPDECDQYQLAFYSDGSEKQMILLTREEFVGLKQHLAGMRVVALPAEATNDEPTGPVPAVKPEFTARVDLARETLAKDVPALDAVEVLCLAAALKAIRLEGSSAFPVEDFVYQILNAYMIDKLTPTEALAEVEVFASEFENMLEAAPEFLATYGRPAA